VIASCKSLKTISNQGLAEKHPIFQKWNIESSKAAYFKLARNAKVINFKLARTQRMAERPPIGRPRYFLEISNQKTVVKMNCNEGW
jgi:hypothetical protein